MDNKVIRYETQIQLVLSSIKKLNSQFALVDILLCYHGRNRNRTAISKEVIEAALPSLYGIPIVGEYIYLDDGSQDFGSHGGKIIISDKGIKFEDTTKPYGFITKDAVDNAKWVTITEKNGIDKHEYLELKNCIVWEKRYEEVSALLEKNYGQSMEISILSDSGYDSDGYLNITEMNFSAACILGSNPDGTDVIPCFESACIGRHYELDSFKQEFSLMLDEYKKFNESDGTTTAVQNNVTNEPNKEEKKFMDLEKLKSFLSTFTVGEGENATEQYALINADENSFTIMDKHDGLRVYTVEFALDDDGNIAADWDGKVEKKFSVVDFETENAVSMNDLIDFNKVIDKCAEEKAFSITEELTATFNEDIKVRDTAYAELNDKYTTATTRLSEYESAEAEAKRLAHKNEIDTIVADFAKKIGRSPKFLVYKAKLKVDEVTTEQVMQDLTLMVGQEMVNKSASFSYQPQEVNVATKTDDEVTNRYGHLLDKYRK